MIPTAQKRHSRIIALAVSLAALVVWGPCVQAGTLYVAISGGESNGAVRSYDTATGALLDANFITGPTKGYSLVGDASGNFYMSQFDNSGGIYKYGPDGTFVKVVVSGLQLPVGMAVDEANNRLYVGLIGFSSGSDKVGIYNLSTGSAINANFITGITDPRRLLLGDGGLFVIDATSNLLSKYSTASANTKIPGFTESNRGSQAWAFQTNGNLVSSNAGGSGVLGEIDPTTGALVSTGASGVSGMSGMAIDEFGSIYVYDQNNARIRKYDASGTLVNADFITLPSGTTSQGLVYAVPEPATTWMVASAGLAGLGFGWRRRRRRSGRRPVADAV